MNFDHSRRLLFGALLISLLVHLLLLFGWGWPRAEPPAAALPPALRALLAVRPAVVASVPAPTVATADARHTPAPAAAVPRTPARPNRLTAPAVPAAAVSADPPVAADAAVPAPPEAAAAAPATVPVATVAASVAGVSADGLRQYRIDLAGAARRYRIYPALARARGWEGVAEVSISVSSGVAPPSLKLVRSSGHAVLDEQALQMLARAVDSTPLPESLRGRSFVLPLPVRFSLEE